MLERDPSGLELRADPTALAPERLLVFELRGSVSEFAKAIARVDGLELIDEEEIEESEGDKKPFVYLLVPDERALKSILSLWKRWERREEVRAAWRDVFQTLRDLRPWGPEDRVSPEEADILARELERHGEDEPLVLEIELVFRKHRETAQASEAEVATAVRGHDGRLIFRSRRESIGYHALLVELPASAVRAIIARMPDSIAGCEPVMHIRPQSILSGITVADVEAPSPAPEVGNLGQPILALLDGVPVVRHRLLERHLVVDDMFSLATGTPVADRVHGTAMASLIIHGDRNRAEQALPRQIHHVPVLATGDEFPKDRLIIDLIYEAVLRMREGPEATAPGVIVVNLSLDNGNRRFYGRMSAWARLLDRLAFDFGLLFVVSAGNIKDPFRLPPYTTGTAFEDADADERARHTLAALHAIAADRRLLSPAETVNGVTIGAVNHDDAPLPMYRGASSNVAPYSDITIANPSSALGPGFGSAVKPDILMPGAREHLRALNGTGSAIEVGIVRPNRFHGLKVAAPPRDGIENAEGWSGCTSAATALASRTCHRIHDALEAEYGEAFLSLPHRDRALILKALLAHTARWPAETADFILSVVDPAKSVHHVRQKDSIRRFLGYGVVDSEAAIACAADRATFWACGMLNANRIATITVPVPLAMHGQPRPHALAATLAWFTPTARGRQTYRSVRLQLLEPQECGALGVKAEGLHPDRNQTAKGTLFHRQWSGKKAPVVTADMSIQLTVQRSPDLGPPVDEPIPYGLAVTLTMPGVAEIYDQVRQRLNVAPRAAVRPA